MVLAESRNKVGLGRALMNARGVSKNQSRRGQGTRSRNGLGPGGDGSVRVSYHPTQCCFMADHCSGFERVKLTVRLSQYTTEIQKEYGSVTEQAALDEFLATAQLADTDFTAGMWLVRTFAREGQTC